MANEKIVNRENLKAFRQAYDTRLENGTLVPEKSQTAKNLLPVSSASGSTQTEPFINQGTATNNNDSQAEVDTGTLGQHLEKQGNTICVNQLVPNNQRDFTNSSIDIKDYFSLQLQVYSNNAWNTILTQNITSIGLYETNIEPTTNGTRFRFKHNGSQTDIILLNIETNVIANHTYHISILFKGINVQTVGGVIANEQAIKDLTQWFNGDIPQDLLDNPSNFYRYYNGSLDYNTGTLVNSNGRYLVNGGQNVWDEETLNGYYNASGVFSSNSNAKASKNYIRVIPNRTYYFYNGSENDGRVCFYDKDKNFIGTKTNANTTFTTPSNCEFIMISTSISYGTTYKNDITISLYYAGEDYSQYVPYEEPKVYDTGDEVLRQAGSAKDTKEPNGTITRRIGYVDLGTLSWVDSGGGIFYAEVSDAKGYFGTYGTTEICSKYASTNDIQNDKSCKFGSSSININIHDSSFVGYTVEQVANALNGVTLYYELATPTTEQGTPFSENMDINDMGNMAWYSAYTDENTNTLVSVPQGCKIFYPAWYVGFIDSLGQRADIEWSADNVVSQSELTSDKTELQGVDTQLKNAIGGTLRQLLAISKSLDFLNTDFVDLGTLNWSYYGDGVFYNTAIARARTTNALCSLYKTLSGNVSIANMNNMELQARTDSDTIYIKNTDYTDTTTFKNAMKGVLLAYEKA